MDSSVLSVVDSQRWSPEWPGSHGMVRIVTVGFGLVVIGMAVTSRQVGYCHGLARVGRVTPTAQANTKENEMTIKEKLAEIEAERKRNKERVLKWKEQNK